MGGCLFEFGYLKSTFWGWGGWGGCLFKATHLKSTFGGGCLFEVGPLLTFSTYRVGVYLRLGAQMNNYGNCLG